MREITRTISVSVNGKSMDFRLTKLDAFSGVTLLRLMAKMPEGGALTGEEDPVNQNSSAGKGENRLSLLLIPRVLWRGDRRIRGGAAA